jgi:hypothetical protein
MCNCKRALKLSNTRTVRNLVYRDEKPGLFHETIINATIMSIMLSQNLKQISWKKHKLFSRKSME